MAHAMLTASKKISKALLVSKKEYFILLTLKELLMKRFSYYLLTAVSVIAMQSTVLAKVTEVKSEAQLEKIFDKHENVVVKFWMQGCPPCNSLKPTFDKVAEEMKNDVAFVAAKGPSDLSSKYSVNSFPTVLYFKDGKQVKKGSVRDVEGLKKEVKKAFGL